jgi:hypothetical protein
VLVLAGSRALCPSHIPSNHTHPLTARTPDLTLTLTSLILLLSFTPSSWPMVDSSISAAEHQQLAASLWASDPASWMPWSKVGVRGVQRDGPEDVHRCRGAGSGRVAGCITSEDAPRLGIDLCLH